MKTIILVALFTFLASCNLQGRFGGCSMASYGNKDAETVTCVVTQKDTKGGPLFVIAWIAKNGMGETTTSGLNELTAIHGKKVQPNTKKQAVYALQSDHSLQQILLDGNQLKTLFDEMQKEGFHPNHSKLWQNQVSPKLAKVEAK